MAEIQTVVCRSCNRPVNMNQVTFDSVKKAYVCNTCHARANTSTITKKRVEERPGIFGGKVAVKDAVVKYSCLKCKYRFSKAKGKEVTICPYCGGNKLEEVSNEASKILADSDKYDF